MKHFVINFGVLIFLLAIVLGGCSQSNTISNPVQTTTTTSTSPSLNSGNITTISADKVIEMKVSCIDPPGAITSQVLQAWIDEFQKRSNGRVKLTFYPAETLGKAADQFNMLKSGVCDVAWILGSQMTPTFPVFGFADLPFVVPQGGPNSLINNLWDKYFKKDWTETKILYLIFNGDTHIHTSKKAINTLEDMKGLQIRAPSTQANTIKALGATPITLSPSEIYSAIEKGMIDGYTFPNYVTLDYKLQEVTKYHIQLSISPGLGSVQMSLKTYNSLPPDLQKIVDDLGPWAQQLHKDLFVKGDKTALDEFKKLNQNVIMVTPEERAKFVQATQSVVDEWITKMEAKGIPAKSIISDVRAYTGN